MKDILFYPYAVLAAIIFNFYTQNTGMFAWVDAAILIAVSTFVLLVAYQVIRFFYKSASKAALLSLIIVLSFCFIGRAHDGHYFMVLPIIVSAGLLYVKSPPQVVGKILNIFSSVLFMVSIAFGASAIMSKKPSNKIASNMAVDSFSAISKASFSARPSIVHIVLDGYSNDESLKHYYGFDNKAFTDRLEKLGFIIFPQARSPYNQTLLVMSSIFSGSYVGKDLLTSIETNKQIRVNLGKNYLNAGLNKSLTKAGYHFYFTDPAYDYIQPPQGAQQASGNHWLVSTAEFSYHFLQNTAAKHFIEKSSVSLPAAKYKKSYDAAFAIHKNASFKEPFFLYQHVLAPHPPFYHDENGKDVGIYKGFGSIEDGSHAIRGDKDRFDNYKHGYINKLKVTNENVLNQLPKIISEIKGDYIVIIHGDHGGGLLYNQNSAEASCMNERFSPYVAMATNIKHLHAAFEHQKDSEFNLVNLYRVIFSEITTEQLALLPEHSGYVSWTNLKDQQDVTHLVAKTCNG